MTVAAAILALGGAALALVAAVGVARFPDAPTRLHAATKAASAGFVLMVLAAGAALGGSAWGLAALMAVFQFMTAPVAAFAIGRTVRAVHAEPRLAPQPPASLPGWMRIGALVLVWLALWGEATVATAVTGIAAAAAVTMVVSREPGAATRLRAVPAARFAAAFAVLLVRSTIGVAVAALGPRRLVDPVVVRIPLRGGSLPALVLTADAVSLTPGTLTMGIDPGARALDVHLIRPDEGAVAAVQRLHALAAAALPSRTARAT
ncbi:MAG: Na+/H+ antiporter subunit E [Actinobacteria bacterium]|nr:Na+/H+ antiporter subunit E [Actinomycetota bacterium]